METLKHRGLRQFTAEEASNIFLGQSGFTLIKTGQELERANGFWVAIKVLTVGTTVEARSVRGDDMTLDALPYDGSSGIDLIQGDIIYGCFDKIKVTGTGTAIIAYIGK